MCFLALVLPRGCHWCHLCMRAGEPRTSTTHWQMATHRQPSVIANSESIVTISRCVTFNIMVGGGAFTFNNESIETSCHRFFFKKKTADRAVCTRVLALRLFARSWTQTSGLGSCTFSSSFFDTDLLRRNGLTMEICRKRKVEGGGPGRQPA